MAEPARMDRRCFLRAAGAAAGGALLAGGCAGAAGASRPAAGDRPNILFCIADDWGWPHAALFGDKVVRTPTFERVARDGVLLRHTYCAAPSCTPSRGSVLTGQMFYRLGEGANLWSTLPAALPVYTDLLEAAGYHVGCTRKGWGPGNVQAGGRTQNAAGRPYKDFGAFLAAAPADRPFCFWFGSYEPHRGYKLGSGAAGGMRPEDVQVPPIWPDAPEVRRDILDYYLEVQQYDRQVGDLLEQLRTAGRLDNTLVVMTSDNGCPFPRCKTNLYDMGTRMPTAAMWLRRVGGGRVVDDFISFTDLAPTFLEAAGLPVPEAMTGRSFLDVLCSDKGGRVDPARDHVVTGRERHHGGARPGRQGYPMRALRTHDYLYIRNFEPDRWPAGDPECRVEGGGTFDYADVDGGPTKTYMLRHREDPAVGPLFDLSFGKRPAEELYDCRNDPHQTKNLAADPACADVRARLAERLASYLKRTADPRAAGRGDVFDTYPYCGGLGEKKAPGT